MRLLPTLQGVVDRRILVNWRIDPDALADVLPEPFRPRTVDGTAIGGVCCIRLRDVRPRGVPGVLGFSSENAAHRFGVDFPAGGHTSSNGDTERTDAGREPGVYVPRRDTSSRLKAAIGSRTFGRHGHAEFDVREGDDRYEIAMQSDDASVEFVATATDDLPADSVFDDVEAAVAYHQCGSVGYSPSPDGSRYEGLEISLDAWDVTPLSVERARSSLFTERLPADAIALDNALAMENVGNSMARRSPIEACPATAPGPS